ncbi:MAG: prepilin-type N-terminal cleavage/methylation domain-containing protein [Candidatus Pacebacteria bacterium]|nr:prepilin-type N-terminal cleavage/methylation domain-containing protein [Candidatus Paceibacterota bacterium]
MKNYSKKGFTLIETVIAIAIFALAMTAVSSFILMLYRSQHYSWEQSIAVDEARKGVETMIKELREAHEGDDGSYVIEKADDKEIVFYSDIDQDDETERVRYFLGNVNSGSQVKTCVTYTSGGSCSVSFSDFFTGTLLSVQVQVSVEGDFGASNEEADVYADSVYLNEICDSGCQDCPGAWQGTSVYDVFSYAGDNSIQFVADANSHVGPNCDWQEPDHSMKARFELTWTEETMGTDLKKGVIEPTSAPVEYPLAQEQISVLSSYVINAPPIFEYFDKNGDKIIDSPARLIDTKMMKIFMVIDADTENDPPAYELESNVRLRNLKNE